MFIKLGTLAASALLLASGNASALLISATGDSTGNPSQPTYQAEISSADVGGSFTLDWLVPAGTSGDSTLPVDLTASVTFSIDSFNIDSTGADQVLLGISISNTTDLSGYPDANSAILSFGFGVTPDAIASIADAGGVFDSVGEGNGPQQTFPGDFKHIDVCVFADGCSGGNINLGLQAGDSDSMALLLTGDFDMNGDSAIGSLTLLDFPLKFQGTWGSFETPGGFREPPPPEKVAEPNTLALMGLALIGLGIRSRRRKA